jgi:hypothetical protein
MMGGSDSKIINEKEALTPAKPATTTPAKPMETPKK